MDENFCIESLIDQYLTGEISPDEAALLWEAIQHDPEVARSLMQHLELSSMLRGLCQSEDYVKSMLKSGRLGDYALEEVSSPPIRSREIKTFSSRFHGKRFWVTTAALVFLAVCGMMIITNRFSGFPDGTTELSSIDMKPPGSELASPEILPNADVSPHIDVARVRVSAFVEWEKDTEIRANEGDVIGPGWIRIRSGTLALAFTSGANVVIEGPAEFQLINPDRAFCAYGQVFADVPKQAIGFQIDVPQTKVIDLGTAFGIKVNPDGTLVHVIQGEVALQDNILRSKHLNTGESVVVKEGGELKTYLPNTLEPEMLHGSLSPVNVEFCERCENQSKAVNADPSLLVHFDFWEADPENQHVNNMSFAGKADIPYGMMQGCQLSRGRCDTTNAVEFKRITDLFTFKFPGKYDAMTMATWIRVENINQTYNAIFTTEGFRTGEIHWHLLYNGALELGINTDDTKPCLQLLTQPVLLPWKGHWVHLAFTVDRSSHEASIYMNGERILHDQNLEMPVPFTFNNGILGNWTFDSVSWTPVHQVRQLTAKMDDFMIFNRAFSPEEIRELYEANYASSANE